MKKMLVEVSIAVNYILSHLYTKLPRRRVDSFGEELERYLHAKYQQHWFPQDPMRDAAYRCLNVGGSQVDLLLPEAAAVSGLDWGEIQACLPEGLVLSVDPGHVACQYHQPQFSTQEFNRYQGTPFWPSAPVSLSSSGCSSASSSISSTNLTPTSNQVTHQVLYCFQDSWFANNNNNNNNNNTNGNPWTDGTAQNKVVHRTDTEHGDNLATAAALSVLVDSEDNFSSNVGSDLAQKTNDFSFNSNGINVSTPSLENTDLVHLLLRDSDLNRASSNGSDNRISVGNLVWPTADTADATNSLVTLINGDLNQSLAPVSNGGATFGDKSRTTFSVLNRSSSNPPQTLDQSNLPMFNDYSALSTTNLNTTALVCSSSTKFDLSGNPIFTGSAIQPRLNAIYGQPGLSQLTSPASTNPFVQKSVSTPSFTAATFAQTKFGSTKLKTHTKRTPNRILSPTTTNTSTTTTAPQTFAAYTGPNVIGRDGINVASLGPNQRNSHGTGLELNPIQRLLPTSLDLNLGQNGKPISSVELPPASFDAVERSADLTPGSGNVVQKKLFAFAGVTQAPAPLAPPSGKEIIQPNIFDDFFPAAMEEAKHSEDPFGNLHLSETLHQPLPNPTKLWSNASTMPFYRGDTSNGATSNLLTASDWLQSSHAFNATAELLAPQPARPVSSSHLVHNSSLTLDSQSSGKLEDSVDLSDEALLSTTRMVTLLLEEGDTNAESTVAHNTIATPKNLEVNIAERALGLVNGQSMSVLDNIPNELGILNGACTE